MLTPYQLDIAARQLCRAKGLSPDLPKDTSFTNFTIFRIQVELADQINDAIAFASEQHDHSGDRR